MQVGIDSFAAATPTDRGGAGDSQSISDLIERIEVADRVGLDVFGIGEHHRREFLDSAPAVILGAAAVRTEKIRLTSAVTVLSAADPVRVFQEFATIDLLSKGRAEMVVGRGSFTESFPLFGFELSQYEELFDDKLDLFAALIRNEAVTWQGRTRPPLANQHVYPQLESGPLRTWIGVGGSQESVVRAAKYNLPLMLAIIGGDPKRFAPYVDLSQRAHAHFGTALQPIGVHSPRYIADTDAKAREELWPSYKQMRDRIGKERGWPPMGHAEFAQEADRGSLYVGAPETVARKIAATVKALGLSRFQLKYSAGPLPHEKLRHSIELYGTKVIPLVRDMLA